MPESLGEASAKERPGRAEPQARPANPAPVEPPGGIRPPDPGLCGPLARALAVRGFCLRERGVTALIKWFFPPPRLERRREGGGAGERRAAEGRRAAADPLAAYRPVSELCLAQTDAGQADVARLSAEASYPGLPYSDIEALPGLHLLCDADAKSPPQAFWRQAELLRDPLSGVFFDPRGAYPLLRERTLVPSFDCAAPWPLAALFEAAALVSRLDYRLPSRPPGLEPGEASEAFQRDLLVMVLGGPYPWKGLSLLRDSGFIGRSWPEVAQLFDVEHSKEFHPEGDAWEHTLETFKYRKSPDLLLSIGLLLHDTGKPLSVAADGRRFDRHAELGGQASRRFLSRLGFPAPTVGAVEFLVSKHMLPAALPRLPLFRSEEALESPLFPLLLELYRCDSSSTFAGPDGYYEACSAFQRYRRNVKNPYRRADGSVDRGGKRRA